MHETIYSYTQRHRGCSHLMCHIMCQPIYELFRPHSQHLQTPKNDVYHESHGKKGLAKNVDVCRFWCKISRPLKSVGVNKVTY